MPLSPTTEPARARSRAAALALGVLLALAGTGARAATGGTATDAGAAQAAVVKPLKITAGTDLRFGQIARGTTAGTLTIDPAGAASATGGVAGATTMAQSGTGRGNAMFAVTGLPLAAFGVSVSTNVQIASGANRMTVTGFTGNVANSAAVLDATGNYTLTVGATLNVNANQAVGTYSGTYVLTVVYQ